MQELRPRAGAEGSSPWHLLAQKLQGGQDRATKLASHTPDCDEAEVCMSQREPESGTDRDRFIVGSRFWSPPLRSKALIFNP